MPLLEEFESAGKWLFRWRSYLPLGLLIVVFLSLEEFCYPLGSHLLDNLWECLCLLISLSGLAIRAITVGYSARGTSGRNTRRQVAEVLNTKGMYSLARHPLYFGNFLMALGFFLFLRIWWVTLVYALAFALYYERIMFAEEAFLRDRFGPAYLDWARRTPAFFPRIANWERPEQSFSLKTAIKRESPSLFALSAAMLLLETVSDFRLTGAFMWDPPWVAGAAAALLFFLVVRVIRKKTHWLDVRGDDPGMLRKPDAG